MKRVRLVRCKDECIATVGDYYIPSDQNITLCNEELFELLDIPKDSKDIIVCFTKEKYKQVDQWEIEKGSTNSIWSPDPVFFAQLKPLVELEIYAEDYLYVQYKNGYRWVHLEY